MGKVELLVPVGNFAMLKQAIHNGADAVYLGGKDFGARKYSTNFTNEELKEVVYYCHLYDVKVYITVNTIVYEKEIPAFLEYIQYLYRISVDALIMQDLGMITLVKSRWPDFIIHASTQLHNHNKEGIALLEKLGVSRVVLDRELSLNEIKNINTSLEKEVFIHGALCISYSGNCLFSSLIGGRSGNRGMCAGSCRLPYQLFEGNHEIKTDGKYLLSTKELSSIHHLKEILDSKIDSLKIEGRMKSEEYVGLVTHIYRNLIDKYYRGEDLTFSEEEVYQLKKIFNRGFTKGFLNQADDQDLMNIKTPNHIGVLLGKVISFDKKRIKIQLDEELNQGDGIRFVKQNKGFVVNYLYNEKGQLIQKAHSYVYLDNTFNIDQKTRVLKTFDSKLKKRLDHYEKKRIPISFSVSATLKEGLIITICDDKNSFSEKSNKIEKANKRATTKEEIQEKLNKINDTPFVCQTFKIDLEENVFIPIHEINQMRRTLIERLRNSRYQERLEYTEKAKPIESSHKPQTHEISIVVRNEEQLKSCLEENVDQIYVDDYALYLKYKDRNKVYYYLDRVNLRYVDYDKDHILVSDLGALLKYSGNLATSCYFNVVNHYTLNYLLNYAYQVTLSVENDWNTIEQMLVGYEREFKQKANVAMVVYGKVDLMITKYCPLHFLVNQERICKVCKKNKKYYLKDRKGEKYRILQKHEITHILHSRNIDYLNQMDKLRKMNITNYIILLLDESKEEIKNILKKVI